MKKDKVFLDTDVILDVLTEREPHFETAVELFLQIQDRTIQAYTSPVIVANILYILNKHLGRKKAIQSLIKLKSLVKVLNCGDRVIELALSSDFKDFEDSIQYYTALENNIDILITRNVKDYKTANITISTPLEYINSRE
ncbi:putative nucleic acid-binding protein, contains PIN domain [Candidatus Electrothrix aarhusensis]|uniref:Putative nucleic acid-binding protein, contains PIN domain n=1 Tax=Candidatus Electrothrix aarhusensis TaxID=1859131 RepID=A0A3S3QPB5_9BACT|nr:putative nucleic acid-binding protein, contains PIN domain [Candidatus Electrothrix aarhusensis]